MLGVGGALGQVLARVGLRAGPDIAEMARGYSSLAHAEASVGGRLATVNPPNVLSVEAVRDLPRTGGPGPLFPALGVGVLVFAVVGRRMVLRTRTR